MRPLPRLPSKVALATVLGAEVVSIERQYPSFSHHATITKIAAATATPGARDSHSRTRKSRTSKALIRPRANYWAGSIGLAIDRTGHRAPSALREQYTTIPRRPPPGFRQHPPAPY